MTYLVVVTPAAQEEPEQVRADRFGAYLGTLASQHVKDNGGTIRDFIAAAGISHNTFYRWRRGDWSGGAPKTQKVNEMHANLGIASTRALDILGLTPEGGRSPDPLAGADPQVAEDILMILRRLKDPNENPDDVVFIRRSLASLAGRSQSGSRRTRNRPAV